MEDDRSGITEYSWMRILRRPVLVDYSLLVGITLAGLIIRSIGLAGNLYSDEVWIISTAVSPAPDFFREILQDWVHPPLYHFLARGWVYLFGISDLSGRLISMTFGVLSIPLIYWLGKQIAGSKTGFFSAALMALSPIHIFHSQYGRHYSLFVFSVMLSMAGFLKVYDQPSHRKYRIFYCISSILLVYTHYFGWLIVFCQLVFFLIGRFTFIKQWAMPQAVICFSYVPWIYIVSRYISKTHSNYHLPTHFDWIEPPSYLEPLNALSIFNGSIPVSHQGKMSILLFGFIALLSLKNLFRKDIKKIQDSILFLFSCVVVPFILVFVVSRTVKPIWITRAMLLSIPSYYLLISIGGQQVKSKMFSYILMLIPLIWMGISAMFHVRSDHRMPYENIASYLEIESGRGVPILVESTYLMNPLFHYYKGSGILYELRENNVSVVPANHKTNLSQILSSEDRLEERFLLVTYTIVGRKMKEEISSKYIVEKQKEYTGCGEEGQIRKVIITFYKGKKLDDTAAIRS